MKKIASASFSNPKAVIYTTIYFSLIGTLICYTLLMKRKPRKYRFTPRGW